MSREIEPGCIALFVGFGGVPAQEVKVVRHAVREDHPRGICCVCKDSIWLCHWKVDGFNYEAACETCLIRIDGHTEDEPVVEEVVG